MLVSAMELMMDQPDVWEGGHPVRMLCISLQGELVLSQVFQFGNFL